MQSVEAVAIAFLNVFSGDGEGCWNKTIIGKWHLEDRIFRS